MRLLLSGMLAAWLVLTATTVQAGSVIEDKAHSPTLGRDIRYSLYLPDQADGPLPVLYLLHGLGGNHRDWLKLGKIEATLDRMITDGTVPPLAVAMPAGGNSWYVDSDRHGPVATAFLKDLFPAIEARHDLARDRSRRFIAGLSMGGYGALRLALHYPDRFRAAASLSGAIFPDLASSKEVTKGQIRMFKGAFGDPFSTERYNTRNFYALLAGLKSRLKASKRRLGLYISVGDDDGFRLYEGAVALYLALKKHKLPVEMRIVDGNHNWRLWRADIVPALGFIADVLKKDAKRNRPSRASND